MRRRGVWCSGLVPASELLVGMAPPDPAIPPFPRRCNLACGACYVVWPGLNELGEAGKMCGSCLDTSHELAPTTPDVALLQAALTTPAMPPVGFRADFGVDFQQVPARRQMDPAPPAWAIAGSPLKKTLFIMSCQHKAHDSLSQFLVCSRFGCSSANTLRIQRLEFGREKLTKGPDVIRQAC